MSAHACPHKGQSMSDQTDMATSEQATISMNEGKAKGTKPRKAKPVSDGKGKRSLNLSIPVETYERLVIHAMRQTGGNISDLVTQLANDHLREYHLTRTAAR